MNGGIPSRLVRWPWGWIFFFGALAVRLGYFFQDAPVPAQDTPDYDEIALNLLRGEGFVARENWFGFALRSWRPPFYPFFLAVIYGLWGYSHQAVKVVQAIVGAGTVSLIYGLGRRLKPSVGLLAGLLAVVYGPLAAVSNEVMSETWFIFWLVLAIYLLISEWASRRERLRLAMGGAAIGLAALTRPVGLLLLPAFAVMALWSDRRKGIGHTFWVALAVCCTIVPWTWRNYVIHGTVVPIATHGGFILARSNAFEPAWRQERGWGIEESFFRQFPGEVERDRYWFRQGISFIRTHPRFYLRLAGERFLRFWYFMRPDYNFWFMVILPFFLAGFWRYKGADGFLLLSCFTSLSLAVFSLVLYGSSRFRLPLEPFFLLFAAAFIQEGWQRWGRRRMGGILAAALAVNLIFWWKAEPFRLLILSLLRQWQLK